LIPCQQISANKFKVKIPVPVFVPPKFFKVIKMSVDLFHLRIDVYIRIGPGRNRFFEISKHDLELKKDRYRIKKEVIDRISQSEEEAGDDDQTSAEEKEEVLQAISPLMMQVKELITCIKEVKKAMLPLTSIPFQMNSQK